MQVPQRKCRLLAVSCHRRLSAIGQQRTLARAGAVNIDGGGRSELSVISLNALLLDKG